MIFSVCGTKAKLTMPTRWTVAPRNVLSASTKKIVFMIFSISKPDPSSVPPVCFPLFLYFIPVDIVFIYQPMDDVFCFGRISPEIFKMLCLKHGSFNAQGDRQRIDQRGVFRLGF